MSTQTVADTAGALPPVTVGSFVLFGYPLESWVLVLTAIYTVIMILKNAPAAIRGLCKGVQLAWQKVQQLKASSRNSTRRSRK